MKEYMQSETQSDTQSDTQAESRSELRQVEVYQGITIVYDPNHEKPYQALMSGPTPRGRWMRSSNLDNLRKFIRAELKKNGVAVDYSERAQASRDDITRRQKFRDKRSRLWKSEKAFEQLGFVKKRSQATSKKEKH